MILFLLYLLSILITLVPMYYGFKWDAKDSYQFRNRNPTVEDFCSFWESGTFVMFIPGLNLLMAAVLVVVGSLVWIGNSKWWNRLMNFTI